MSDTDFLFDIEGVDSSYYKQLYEKAKLFRSLFRVSRSYDKDFYSNVPAWHTLPIDSIHYHMLQVFRFQIYLPKNIWAKKYVAR